MTKKQIHVVDSNILIMGFTFKKNCPDLRNTRIIDIVNGFKAKHCNIDVYDPWVNEKEANSEYGIIPVRKPAKSKYDAVILAVDHDEFRELTKKQIESLCKDNFVLYDIKYLLDADQVDGRL